MARALIICRGDILAAGVMRGWLESGNEIAEIWASPTDRIRTSQRLVRTLCPDWTVARSMPQNFRNWR